VPTFRAAQLGVEVAHEPPQHSARAWTEPEHQQVVVRQDAPVAAGRCQGDARYPQEPVDTADRCEAVREHEQHVRPGGDERLGGDRLVVLDPRLGTCVDAARGDDHRVGTRLRPADQLRTRPAQIEERDSWMALRRRRLSSGDGDLAGDLPSEALAPPGDAERLAHLAQLPRACVERVVLAQNRDRHPCGAKLLEHGRRTGLRGADHHCRPQREDPLSGQLALVADLRQAGDRLRRVERARVDAHQVAAEPEREDGFRDVAVQRDDAADVADDDRAAVLVPNARRQDGSLLVGRRPLGGGGDRDRGRAGQRCAGGQDDQQGQQQRAPHRDASSVSS
jgi:hypothetical protein